MRCLAFMVGVLFLPSISLAEEKQEANPEPPNAEFDRRFAVMLYGGFGSPTPLPQILRIRELEPTLDGILTVGAHYRLATDRKWVSFELESTLSQHLEQWGRLSLGMAAVLRFHQPPWRSWVESTFAVGNGLSYATEPPDIERRYLTRTSRWLYHLVFELTFHLKSMPEWELLFRIHHRSGIFGIFDNVSGGSDFICLGLRYRI